MQRLQLQNLESNLRDDAVSQTVEPSLPLSPLQGGMLFQALLSGQGGDGFGIEQLIIELLEPVDQLIVENAFTSLLNRHPALSASFHATPGGGALHQAEGRPYQSFHRNLQVPVEVASLAATDSFLRKSEFEQFLAHDRDRGFDLAAPPLMRATIVVDEMGKADLVWTFHQILVDNQSIAQFAYELLETVEAYRDERLPDLGPEPRPYKDYLQFCAERDHEGGVEYFRRLLAGKRTPTAVPLAEPAARSLADTGYGAMERVCSAQVCAGVRALAESTQTAVSTVIEAMWSLVLSRYSGDQDVIFGNARAGRDVFGPDAAEMVGLFINTVATRADVSDEWSVKDLLQSLREQDLAICPHETIPLSAVYRSSEIGPGIPLFETLVIFQNRKLQEALAELGGAKWKGRAVQLREQPFFPLTLTAFDGAELELRMLFDRKRLSETAVRRLLESCEQALRELTLDPNRKLAEIDVLPPAERKKILLEWNDTARPFSDQICIYGLFEARVNEQPDAPAVEARGEVLTYRELEERANRLAQVLISRGVEPGRYVGICLSRGLDLVTTMLAIVKAGAAYVPLDPTYPAERLSLMLSDVDAALVITEAKSEQALDYARIVLDGADREEWDSASSDRPPRRTTPEARCYTIFTSGSTGRPKGVVLTHRAVVNTLEWINREFEMCPSDRLLFVTSPCFDLSVYDVFGMLGAGGTVVVATEEVLSDPRALASFLVDAKITVWDSAPAALQRLAPFIAERGGTDLRLCMLSGDWIPLSLPDAVRSAFPGSRVMSLGGATEAAIWSNWYPIEEVQDGWVSIPYGKPIQNARYHVLDRRMQPVPVGVPGDLYIGGACLASGYHGREQLTAEQFVRDPFRPEENERLYKTGDLARYFEDGNLEFLGRSDFQVKIRGFRVEMGEVEAVISQLDEVRVAVCAAYSDATGLKSLVAYVVPMRQVELEEEAIKSFVAEKLPSFMVPSRILFLNILPTTSNGKLDRAALPEPNLRDDSEVFVPPEGAVEEELVRMWSNLLERNRVSVQDNFFAIGGHSLLAVMLIARIKHRFTIDLPLATLLANPTIRRLAPHIEGKIGVQSATRHLQAFNRDGSQAPLVLVPGVVGTAFTYRSLPDTLGAQQPIYVIDLLAADSAENFPDTIEGMADLYEEEILEACGDSPIILGGFSFGALIAFELARRLRRKGVPVPLLVSFDGFAPGYPYYLPTPERILAHTREFLSRDFRGRLEYLKDRSVRLKRRVLNWLGRAEEVSDAVPKHELQAHMNKVRNVQIHAGKTYRPQGAEKDLALLLIRAEETPYWVGMKMDDPLHGWRRYIGGPISLITFPGDHMQIWDEENRQLVTSAIAEHLARFTHQTRQTSPDPTNNQSLRAESALSPLVS
ncbi:non-ribosomal peptide synthetase [Microbulbifer hainanensis]|uniref:non-ribosomal peptide synthetase n=1 Tax=Microbulbifer hainanensis TaxID=2735675 RepID=UPI00186880EB|nr:non-ribosomal peptide synthetase [Microbulbifer hainanensis]